jgi:hypothetical protein
MSRSRTNQTFAATLALTSMLAGCSDIYHDRRETIALSAGDAMAANRVTHTVDPWPLSSANRNLAFNGEKMQTAVERYRQNRIIQPVNINTSSAAYERAQAAAAAAASASPTSGKP